MNGANELRQNYAGVFDGRLGFGARPVLLSIDFMCAYTTEDAPFFAPGVVAADLVIVKNYASAFFGTSLSATLTAQGIDTLILTGCSTSGCIRATAIDGIQNGFRVIVPRECVGDRRQEPHEANLFDIDAKYGDVVSKRETLDYLARLRSQRAAE